MTVKERIKEYCKYKKTSIREFEKSSKLMYGYVNGIRVSIQPDKIRGIASHYTDLNIEWLLTGEGEMLRAEQHIGDIKNSTIVGGTVSGSGNMISNNASESESYKKEVEHLKIIINEKDKQLAEKERIINLLMKQTINSH